MLTTVQFSKVNKILGLSVLINEKGKYCTFVRFSGHVDEMEIDVRKSKKHYNEEIARSTFSLKRGRWGNKTLDERFDEVITTLEKFLLEDEVPYDYLQEIERIEYDYKF